MKWGIMKLFPLFSALLYSGFKNSFVSLFTVSLFPYLLLELDIFSRFGNH